MNLEDHIVDLGENGVFAMSLFPWSGTYGPPVFPQHYYADWYDANGVKSSRLSLCIRSFAGSPLQEFFSAQKQLRQTAVKSVREMTAFLASQVDKDQVALLPERAIRIDDAHLLLIFLGDVGDPLLRLINIPEDRVVREWQSADWLPAGADIEQDTRFATLINGEKFFKRERAKLLHAWDPYFLLSTPSYDSFLFRAGMNGIANVSTEAGHLYDCLGIIGDVAIMSVDEKRLKLHCIKDRTESFVDLKCKGRIGSVAGCDRPGRLVVGHDGGTIELLDESRKLWKGYRPIPKAGKNASCLVQMSRSGRFIITSDYCDHYVIDTELGLIAELDVPPQDQDELWVFTPVVKFTPAFIATDNAFLVMHRGVPIITPYQNLNWARAIEVKAPNSAARRRFPARLLKKWRKPGLQLIPVKSGETQVSGSSHLYGTVALEDGLQWPSFDSLPMMLLCQIDLAEAAAALPGSPFPDHGKLLVFVAVNAAGELVEHDFMPAKVEVLFSTQPPAARTHESIVPSLPEIPLELRQARNDLPYIDAAIVEAEELDDERLEEYRAHLEASRREPPRADFRFGGYPAAIQGNTLEREAQGFRETGEFFTLSDDLHASLKWRLLLQFDSDKELMWGTDMGKLHLMIHEDDLAARDFSRVVAIATGY